MTALEFAQVQIGNKKAEFVRLKHMLDTKGLIPGDERAGVKSQIDVVKADVELLDRVIKTEARRA